jgi:hybrid cluster-associated redox disulfide protein
MKVTENMLLTEILDMEPDPTEVFLRHGLNCLGCPGASSESLKEAADGHGIDLVKLMNDLNAFIEKEQ